MTKLWLYALIVGAFFLPSSGSGQERPQQHLRNSISDRFRAPKSMELPRDTTITDGVDSLGMVASIGPKLFIRAAHDDGTHYWAMTGSGGGGISTLSRTISTNGSGPYVPVYVGSNVQVTGVTVGDDPLAEGSDILRYEVVQDTLRIYYTRPPYGNVNYIIYTGTPDSSNTMAPRLNTPVLTATTMGTTSILLEADSISGATSYVLNGSFDSSNWSYITTIPPPPGNISYLYDSLESNTMYYFQLQAVAADTSPYISSNFGYASAKTAALVTLQTPSLTTGTVSDSSATLNWGTISGAGNFLLQYSIDTVNWSTGIVLYSTDTTYTFTGLNSSTTYHFRLQAQSSQEGYANSGYAQVAVTTDAPPATQLATPGISATNNDPYYNVIEITPVSNATGYDIEYLNDSTWETLITLDPNVTSYTHSGLSPNTFFQYRTKANGNGISYYDSPYAYDTITTEQEPVIPDTVQLAKPVPTLTVTGPNSMTLNWGAIEHAQGYHVEISTNGTTWQSPADYDSTILSIVLSGLQADTRYYARVSATTTNELYINSDYGVTNATTQALIKLAKQTLTATNISSTENTVSFTNIANEDSILVQYSLNKITWSKLAMLAPNITSVHHTNLTPNTEYYYRSRGMVFNSSTYQTGPWSNTDSATTPTAAVNLQTPSIEATAVNSFTAQITWTNIPNESNYTLERSNDGNIWTLLATLAPNVTTYSDPTLPANFIVWYRVRANGNGSTFLTSGYSTDTTKTPPEEEGATKFGLISTPNESGLQQFVISSNTADSLTMCVVRSAWTASVNTVGNIKTLSEGGKEIILNVNNMQANQGRNFTLDEERAAFVYQVDTLIRRQLIGRNVHILVVNNEENNTGYRELDTVPNSPTNSAKLYFNNEVRVVDSIAKAVGNGQFKVTPGGLTGKNMYWFTWRNLMDSGKVTEAAELAYQVFPPAERRNLATYDKDNVSITMIKQLIPLYKTAAFNYINIHIKTPLNGVDSTHIDPNVVAYTLWAWHNLTGKEVGSNEVGAKSIVPAISAELVQAGMDGKVPFWILYDGEGTVTTPLPSGIDVSLRDATGKALNDIGKAVATKLMQIQEDSQ